MDKQFVFLNFHTEYSSDGTVKKRMQREYCFSTIFYADAHQDNEYKIKFYRGLCGVNDGAKNNACFLTKDELFYFISIAKRIHDFDLDIQEKGNDLFIVHIKLDAPRVVHRYILSWLRYAYEFPFNMYLGDAMRLKKTTGFKRDDLFNLYNLVSATSGYRWHGDFIHAIGDSNEIRPFFTPKEQIELVNNYDPKGEINYIFPTIKIRDFQRFIYNFNNYTDNLQSLEYWEDPEEFKKRLTFYKTNKELIKNYKKK